MTYSILITLLAVVLVAYGGYLWGFLSFTVVPGVAAESRRGRGTMTRRNLKCFHLDEDGCVSHWIAAPDEATAKAVMVGQVLSMGTVEECSDAEWSCEELSPEQARGATLRDEEDPPCANMWEATVAVREPTYLACSEW